MPVYSDDALTLFHGSPIVVEEPSLEKGRPHNDYGRGFYCTEEFDKACEWACKVGKDGFVNCYNLEAEGLRTLNLLDGFHHILEWIALLLHNRTFALRSPLAVDAREYLLSNFLIDTSSYDIIRGYRADDSYFAYAEAFVESTLSLNQLSRALYLGKLGTQTVLVSQDAFDHLSFTSASLANAAKYYPRFIQRDEAARSEYRKMTQSAQSYREELFVLDLMREEVASDDPRLQRIIP